LIIGHCTLIIPRMPRRLLHFRFTFAVLGLAALLSGALLETIWLAGPGAVAAAVSDLIGIVQARARFPMPADRALRGAAEALPALGMTAFEPAAIGITVAVVIYALMANGIQTVSLSRGTNLTLTMGETLRRVLTSAGSLLVLAVPLAAIANVDLPGRMKLSSLTVAAIGCGLAALGGIVSLVIMWRSVGQTRSAPNVDT
jgi:hypothetical protein